MTVVVMNAETLAISEHTGTPADVFAYSGNVYRVNPTSLKYFGVADSTAELPTMNLTTGMLDLGSRKTKIISRAYAYMKSAVAATFKTITEHLGTLTTTTYSIANSTKTNERVQEVRLGKGVRFTAFKVEITNADGADLVLTNLRVQPVTVRKKYD